MQPAPPTASTADNAADLAVAIEHVSRCFSRVRALDDVSFNVPARSIFGLLGPNGAGKTTLFSIIANFIHADAGTARVLGVDSRNVRRLHKRLSILPQDAQFQRSVPIIEQLIFFRMLDGLPRQTARDDVARTLSLVGLEPSSRQRVGALSHGMVKRLGIAQAFLGTPEVILLDEPTAGLDPAGAHQIRELIRQLQSRATIVVSSHNLAEIQELCDHVAILDKGRLVLSGSIDEITKSGREYNLTLSRPLTPIECDRVRSLPGVFELLAEAHTPGAARPVANYTIRLDLASSGRNPDELIADLLRTLLNFGVTPRRFAEGRSLEAQFLQVTGAAPSGSKFPPVS